MWLLAVVSPAAAADFPVVTEILANLCGTGKFILSPEYPCQLRIFGFTIAWSECSNAYLTDMRGFRNCINSCLVSEKERCLQICGPNTTKTRYCYSECGRLSSCVETAISLGTGPVSAAGYYRDCFRGELDMLQVGSALAGRLATGAAAPLHAGGAAALRPSQSEGRLAFLQSRSGSSSETEALPSVDAVTADVDRCACDLIGVVQGVKTGQGGCARHAREPAAKLSQYCYVTGGARCAGAVASSLFSGLYWTGCRRPTYEEVFPEGCEIIGHQDYMQAEWESEFYIKAVQKWQDLQRSLTVNLKVNLTIPAPPIDIRALVALKQAQKQFRGSWSEKVPDDWQQTEIRQWTGIARELPLDELPLPPGIDIEHGPRSAEITPVLGDAGLGSYKKLSGTAWTLAVA